MITPEEKIKVLITVPFAEDTLQRFRDVSPYLEIISRPARTYADIVTDVWQEAEVLYTAQVYPPDGCLENVKWVQSHFAGVDTVLKQPCIQSDREIIITSMRGIHASNMAEYVMGMILAFGHRIPEMMQSQARKEWSEDRFDRFMPLELRHATVGIVGYGAIGREIARLVKLLGGKVLAVKRDARTVEDRNHFMREGTGDPEGDFFDRLYPPQALGTMIRDCDYVVIILPLTDATRGLYNQQIIQKMKKGAYLINMGRGGVVDEPALMEALKSGHLRGAIMDVFEQEPIPPDSPLWTTPNLIITPHIAGNTTDYHAKAAEVFEENLRRYTQREPLLNLVDRDLGY